MDAPLLKSTPGCHWGGIGWSILSAKARLRAAPLAAAGAAAFAGGGGWLAGAPADPMRPTSPGAEPW
eukprot:727146-Hanusia_phi.AAC.1